MIDTAITLASIPAILALVNLFKSFGVQGRWSALAAVLIAVGIVAAESWAPTGIYDVLSRGVVLGLAAAGLYDVTKQMPAIQSVAGQPGTDKPARTHTIDT